MRQAAARTGKATRAVLAGLAKGLRKPFRRMLQAL